MAGRYFIGLPLCGALGHGAVTLANDFSARFGVPSATEKCAPHVTLKAPFEADGAQIAELSKIVSVACAMMHPISVAAEGLGRFDDRVLFMDVEPNASLRAFAKKIESIFRTRLSWMQFSEHDGGEKKFHVTVAKGAFSPGELDTATRLRDDLPRLSETCRTLALFERRGGRWVVAAEWPFDTCE